MLNNAEKYKDLIHSKYLGQKSLDDLQSFLKKEFKQTFKFYNEKNEDIRRRIVVNKNENAIPNEFTKIKNTRSQNLFLGRLSNIIKYLAIYLVEELKNEDTKKRKIYLPGREWRESVPFVDRWLSEYYDDLKKGLFSNSFELLSET